MSTVQVTEIVNTVTPADEDTEVIEATPLLQEVAVIDVVTTVVEAPADQGPEGPPGPGGADAHYEHIQSTPSANWVITHNLGKIPSVTIIDSAKDEIIADVEHVSINQVSISFISAFSGKAYLN